ncbi:MAG: DUF4864 domain-containing protein [Xenococcaceae cyanobacterium MO_167.B27]|nr:DUF4864 domain-containing protein [Xenococcaceae cyanobacterium MO_167.B27]
MQLKDEIITFLWLRQMYLSEYDKAEIRRIIETQLKAFGEDNQIQAFGFASPKIQQQFGTPENFLKMVKTQYHPVYRPRAVMFRGFTTVNHFPAQILYIMDSKGEVIQVVYVMQQQSDRSWRIHGCFFVPLDETLNQL